MLAERKKIQLRRCKACNAVGHNRATCKNEPFIVVASNKTATERPPQPQKQSAMTAPKPLKFFVHHVSHDTEPSPHVVNLRKNNENVWNRVETASPEQATSLYHSYHQIPTTEESAPAIFAIPANFIKEEKQTFFDKVQRTLTSLSTSQKPEAIFNSALTDSASFKTTSNQQTHYNSSWITEAITRFKARIPVRQLVSAVVLLTILAAIPGPALGYYEKMVVTKAVVTKESTDAFNALRESTNALKNADLTKAVESTNIALHKFNKTLATLEDHQFAETVASMIPNFGNSFESRQKLLVAGHEITVGNSYLLEGFAKAQQKNQTFTERLTLLLRSLHEALPNYEKAETNLQSVDPKTVPTEYQAQFAEFKDLLTGLVTDFKTVDQLGSSLLDIFGAAGNRRYLLVFQNPHEIRATGGFMGSFAVMDIKDGEITKLDIPAGGSYDLQGQLKKFVEPPTPLLLSNKRWEFQDANWFPDFPSSANKMLWFYRNSYGVTADGVIAINATVLERLLSVLGPITDNKRNITLNAASVLPTLQKIVEEGPEKKANKPKQVIADLAPILIESIKNADIKTLLPILSQTQAAIEQKEIQMYFRDETIENTVKELGWSGALLNISPEQDYLMVVNSNIQGQKTDAVMSQNISHQSVVDDEGSIVNTITITRTHAGKADDSLYGGANVNYLRVYVPEGSELINATGFTWPEEKAFRSPDNWTTKDNDLQNIEQEQSIDKQSGTRITHEFGKTSFGNWVITEPGASSQVTFTYRLPFKLTSLKKDDTALGKLLSPLQESIARYQLVVQKQSGVRTTFDSQIIFNNAWKPYWQEGHQMIPATNGARIESNELTKDSVWSLVMHH